MPELVFLLDVDNTLLDNDRLKNDLAVQIRKLVGDAAAERFWEIYEIVRAEEKYVDLPATLNRFNSEFPDSDGRLDRLVKGVEFRSYVYPGALRALAYLKSIGTPVILSDGDPVFQKMKIERSGLARRVGNQVVLTVHKQAEMPGVLERYQAAHYALIDDKTTILADIGRLYPDRITTVLVCQGKYARLRATPHPDIVLPHIRDVVHVPRNEFIRAVDAATAD